MSTNIFGIDLSKQQTIFGAQPNQFGDQSKPTGTPSPFGNTSMFGAPSNDPFNNTGGQFGTGNTQNQNKPTIGNAFSQNTFGNMGNQNDPTKSIQGKPSNPPQTGIFGGPNISNAIPTNTNQPNIFGQANIQSLGTPSTGTSQFGQTNTQQPSLFGTTNTSQSTFPNFGTQNQSIPKPTIPSAPSNLFSNTNPTADKPDASKPTNLFGTSFTGQKPNDQASIFGGTPSTIAQTSEKRPSTGLLDKISPPLSLQPEGGKATIAPTTFAPATVDTKPKVEEKKVSLFGDQKLTQQAQPSILSQPIQQSVSKPGLEEGKKQEEMPQFDTMNKKKVKGIIETWKTDLKDLVNGFGDMSGKLMDYEKEIHETTEELLKHNAMINEMTDAANKSRKSLDNIITSQQDIEKCVNSIYTYLSTQLPKQDLDELINETKDFENSHLYHVPKPTNMQCISLSDQISEMEKKVDNIVKCINSKSNESQNDINSNLEDQLSSVYNILEALNEKAIAQSDQINKSEGAIKNIKSSLNL
jgi:hypothetical protein